MDTCADCGMPMCPRVGSEHYRLAYGRERAASASLREQLARVTQERDALRLALHPGPAWMMSVKISNLELLLAAARSRIEALEAALRCPHGVEYEMVTNCDACIDAALAPAEPAAAPKEET